MTDRTRLAVEIEGALAASNLPTDATIRERADDLADRLRRAGVIATAPGNEVLEYDPSRGHAHLVVNGREVVEYPDCSDKEVAAMAARAVILDPTVLNPTAAARVVAWAHERFGTEVPF